MTASPSLEYTDGIAVFRPEGTMTLADAVGLIAWAIGEARRRRCDGLLVLMTSASGFASPSIAARHEMMRKWAVVADGRLRMAMVIPPEFVDPERFGEISAANFGLIGKGFLAEAEAMDWLRGAV